MEALEWEHIKLIWQQVVIQAQVVEATDTDHQTLDTLLGLAVMSMPLSARPPSMALQGPWVLAAALQQALTWPW